LFWHSAAGVFSVWTCDGAGGFPADQRYAVPVPGAEPGWQPAILANIDGAGAPEVIWREGASGRLAFSRIVWVEGRLAPQAGSPLDPEQPADFNWTLRAADDFDGDGRDDLVFQNETSEKSVVWYMEGAARREGNFFLPDRLAPEDVEPGTPQSWPIIGPR
jgi:hypothetical protein